MDTERILEARVGKALRSLREAARLKPIQLARQSLVHPSQISRYEAGVLCPPRVVLQAILNELHKVLSVDVASDVTTFLSRLGLTPEEYDTIRSKTYLHPDMLTGLQEARNVNEINEWLVEEVVNRRRGKRQSLPDLDKLNTDLSLHLTNARDAAIAYPAHPLAFNPDIVSPHDGYYSSISFEFLQSLLHGYLSNGPRFTGMDGLSQKLWLLDIFQQLAKPIIDVGGTRAVLATHILDIYQQTYDAFHQQMKMKKWQYLDIVPKSAIRELVRTGRLSRDLSLKYLGASDLCPGMVRDLLFYVMGLIRAYESTYHLALIDDVSDPTDGAVKLLTQHLTDHFGPLSQGRMDNST
jgi:transcriptional regulator with XRE-family HTH domain